MKTTMRSFKMITFCFNLPWNHLNHLQFLSYSKSHVLSKATSFSVLYKAPFPLFCFMSFYEILLVVFYTLWTGLVDLSNLLHFLRAQHSDVSRGKNRPAETSLCTCCFHCNALILALCYAIRWTSLRQIADSALRSTQRAPVPGIPVLGHFGSRDVMNMLHLRHHNLIVYFVFFSKNGVDLKASIHSLLSSSRWKFHGSHCLVGRMFETPTLFWSSTSFPHKTDIQIFMTAQFSQPKGESSTGAVPRQNAWFKKPGGFWQHP